MSLLDEERLKKISLEMMELVGRRDGQALQAMLKGKLVRWWIELALMGFAFTAHKAATQVLAVRIAAKATRAQDLFSEWGLRANDLASDGDTDSPPPASGAETPLN